jgi:hypothetical protein
MQARSRSIVARSPAVISASIRIGMTESLPAGAQPGKSDSAPLPLRRW